VSELAGVENELGQAAVLVQSLAEAGTITAAVAEQLLGALGNGQPPAPHDGALYVAVRALYAIRDVTGTSTEAHHMARDALGQIGAVSAPAPRSSDRSEAIAALDQADTHSGDALQAQYGATMALIGIGRAILAVDATLREQNELIASGYDGYYGIETVDTKGRT
jgi:hypothetical protein